MWTYISTFSFVSRLNLWPASTLWAWSTHFGPWWSCQDGYWHKFWVESHQSWTLFIPWQTNGSVSSGPYHLFLSSLLSCLSSNASINFVDPPLDLPSDSVAFMKTTGRGKEWKFDRRRNNLIILYARYFYQVNNGMNK